MRIYTGSTNCDDRGKHGNSKGKIMVNLLENIRDPEEIEKLNKQLVQNGKEAKYDLSKAHLNIYFEEGCRTYEEAFEFVFGGAMEEYNAQQKRADRRTSIEKELEKLSKGKVEQELIHSMVVQVGDHENHPPEGESIEILTEYYQQFKEQFPNIKVVSAVIHVDEQKDGTVHLQMYWIPFKTKEQHEAMGNQKKWSGMSKQPSLSGALQQMGYDNSATYTHEDGTVTHDYKNGAMAQFQKDFNKLLDDICLEHDIQIDHYMSGKKVTHQDTYDYYSGKINADVQKALHVAENAEKKETEALFKLENTEEKLQKAQTKNDALEEENRSLSRALKESYKDMEKDFLQIADEHFAYYKRAKVKIEKDPRIYESFAAARKLTKRAQNAWYKCRTCRTRRGRIRWAKKAQRLQAQANEAWGMAKGEAEYARQEAAIRRQKAEIKKEINELLKPQIADYKTFCKAFDALSEERQKQYAEKFKTIQQKNQKDIKDMSKHLKHLFGSNNKVMEYDLIKQVQADRREMNKLTNRMIADKKFDDQNDITADDDFEEMER